MNDEGTHTARQAFRQGDLESTEFRSVTAIRPADHVGHHAGQTRVTVTPVDLPGDRLTAE